MIQNNNFKCRFERVPLWLVPLWKSATTKILLKFTHLLKVIFSDAWHKKVFWFGQWKNYRVYFEYFCMFLLGGKHSIKEKLCFIKVYISLSSQIFWVSYLCRTKDIIYFQQYIVQLRRYLFCLETFAKNVKEFHIGSEESKISA